MVAIQNLFYMTQIKDILSEPVPGRIDDPIYVMLYLFVCVYIIAVPGLALEPAEHFFGFNAQIRRND